jgi:hypothetical protein
MYSIHESTNFGRIVNPGIPVFLQVIQNNVTFLVLGSVLVEVVLLRFTCIPQFIE